MPTLHTATKLIKFSAAHRLLNYHGGCENIHGHNYIAEITFGARNLSKDSSMIIDFKTIKETIGKWVMNYWDHAIILNPLDNSLLKFVKDDGMKYAVMSEGNPTAENMCKELWYICETFNSSIVQVKVWETDSSYAELF